MTLIATTVVRVGVLVERTASEYRPFVYRMFFCRQRDPGTPTLCPIADWAREEVSCMPYHGFNALFRRMNVGERRRYWMHLRLECTRDYWGDYDTDVEPLSIKRA